MGTIPPSSRGLSPIAPGVLPTERLSPGHTLLHTNSKIKAGKGSLSASPAIREKIYDGFFAPNPREPKKDFQKFIEKFSEYAGSTGVLSGRILRKIDDVSQTKTDKTPKPSVLDKEAAFAKLRATFAKEKSDDAKNLMSLALQGEFALFRNLTQVHFDDMVSVHEAYAKAHPPQDAEGTDTHAIKLQDIIHIFQRVQEEEKHQNIRLSSQQRTEIARAVALSEAFHTGQDLGDGGYLGHIHDLVAAKKGGLPE